MKSGICNQSYIPLRSLPSGTSEMVSQLLFGEIYTILQTENDWVMVENIFDHYKGWLAKNCICILPNDSFSDIENTPYFVYNQPIGRVRNVETRESMYISAGSILHGMQGNKFTLLNKSYYVEEILTIPNTGNKAGEVTGLAQQMLNVPYLWGGRSVFGIDCSGLVQTCFRVAGIHLPRDAWQQAEKGEKIEHLIHGRAADVAFFSNPEGRIVHTGILLNNHQIVHASGRVRIDAIDENGIINSETNQYSHKLSFVKRIIE